VIADVNLTAFAVALPPGLLFLSFLQELPSTSSDIADASRMFLVLMFVVLYFLIPD
jgi:hypothetical protein